MITDVILPQWLDNLIFDKLGAKYCRSCSDMTVIDWDRSDVMNYLGTYFPRSYAESKCIFSEFFCRFPNKWKDVDHLDVFDFGCGTGGEIIGLAIAAAEKIQNVKEIKVKALDGNAYALRLLERVAAFCTSRIGIKLCINVVPCKIDDFYDLSVLDNILDRQFDIAMSVKSICEFVTKECFEQKNAYQHIAQFMLSKLNDSGIIFLEDVTTYNNVSQEWLPKMMDKGLENYGRHIIMKNDGYNQTFTVSHTRRNKDTSKVAWRIIQKSNQI